MNKKMFALTYCFEGVDDSCPYATTIAVSEDEENSVRKWRNVLRRTAQNQQARTMLGAQIAITKLLANIIMR